MTETETLARHRAVLSGPPDVKQGQESLRKD